MRRGDIWWANLPKPIGRRPILLISREDAYRVRSKLIASMVTTRVRGIAAEVRLGTKDGLDRPCVVNLDSLLMVPTNTLAEWVTTLSPAKMQEVEEAIHYALGLEK